MLPIVLASGSKYRAELLRKLHLDFTAHSGDVDESAFEGEAAERLAIRLSLAKAEAIGSRFPHHLIIGSDQVAVCDDKILHKPGSRELAIKQLKAQSGRCVKFYTGICVLNSETRQGFSDVDVCSVYFKYLKDEQIERYVDLDRPFDCAGSFKSEALGVALFDKIEGDDPNALIGLPLIKLIALLEKFGVSVL